MKCAFLIASVLCLLNIKGAGAHVFIKINYKTLGVEHTAYCDADWAFQLDSNILNSPVLFEKEFLKNNADVVHLYSDINNYEYLTGAYFSYHQYQLSGEKHTIHSKEITSIEYLQRYVISSYHTIIFNEITEEWKNWALEEPTTDYPFGNDVGCRLEVNYFNKTYKLSPSLEQFLWLYQNVKQRGECHSSLLNRLGEKLTLEHIVVIELCGC